MKATLRPVDDDAKDTAPSPSLLRRVPHHMSNKMIQMHGGIGVTDAFDTGLSLERARNRRSHLGQPRLPARRTESLLVLRHNQ